jgi:hypothetical protein
MTIFFKMKMKRNKYFPKSTTKLLFSHGNTLILDSCFQGFVVWGHPMNFAFNIYFAYNITFLLGPPKGMCNLWTPSRLLMTFVCLEVLGFLEMRITILLKAPYSSNGGIRVITTIVLTRPQTQDQHNYDTHNYELKFSIMSSNHLTYFCSY